MKNQKRIVSLFVCLAVLVSMVFVACTPQAANTTAATETVQTTAAPETEQTTAEPETTQPQSETEPPETTEETPLVFEPEADSLLASLPRVEEGDYVGSREMGDGAEMMIYHIDSEAGFEAYEKELSSDGFELYARNLIEANEFATWTDEDTTVTLIYMPDYDGMLRVVAEPRGPLPAVSPGTYETVCTPALAMVGTDFSGYKQNGMCFVYRLSDGSFMVVDSGFNQDACADALYNTLEKMAVDPDNIVIAAWIFTHAHNDHLSGFFAFTNTYGKKVKVENFIINFPSEDVFVSSDANTNFIARMRSNAAEYPDAEIYEAHPGQVYYIRDAVVTMLYTWEMYTANEQISYFNNSSLVFTVDLGGEKILQFGDCGPLAARIMQMIYSPDTLKSDIVQVSHHGFQSVTPDLNEMVEPEVALWPTSKSHYDSVWNLAYNKVFENVENIYIADRYVYMFELPFDADKVEVWPAFEE